MEGVEAAAVGAAQRHADRAAVADDERGQRAAAGDLGEAGDDPVGVLRSDSPPGKRQPAPPRRQAA